MMFDPTAVDFTDEEKALAEDLAALIKGTREIKGDNNKFDMSDLIAIPELVPKVIRLVEHITKGDKGDPEDDALIAHRGVSLFTAYGRGSGLLKSFAPKPSDG